MKKNKIKPYKEWLKQAEYDLDTAKAMFKTGRYIYTIFMCHLTIEKILKAIFVQKTQKAPLRTHNLNYFLVKLNINLKEKELDFIDNLNNLSVPTRYPDEIEKLLKEYKKRETNTILKKTEELFLCLKKMF